MTSSRPWSGLSRRQMLAAPLALATAARAKPGPALPLPSVVDLSALFGPAKEQGDRMTCAYFAVTAVAEALLTRKAGLPVTLSEQYLTDLAHAGGRLPADETTDIGEVWDLVEDYGMVPAATLPYQPRLAAGQPVRGPNAALLVKGRRLKFTRVDRFDSTVEGLQQGLLRGPLVVALAYPHNLSGWHDDGLIEPVLSLVPSGEAREDYPNHFVVLTGYDQRKQMFLLRNSWGPGWGRNGYGRISFAAMRTRWRTGDASYFLLGPEPWGRDRLPLSATSASG